MDNNHNSAIPQDNQNHEPANKPKFKGSLVKESNGQVQGQNQYPNQPYGQQQSYYGKQANPSSVLNSTRNLVGDKTPSAATPDNRYEERGVPNAEIYQQQAPYLPIAPMPHSEKSNKAPIIILLIVSLLVLATAGFFCYYAFIYRNDHKNLKEQIGADINLPQEEFTVSTDTATVLSSGKCGDGISYELTKDGILTLRGSGNTYNFTSDSVPWKDYCSYISKIHIINGITGIGDYAFWCCSNLKELVLPDSLESIGKRAFGYCGIKEFIIYDNIEYIASHAFMECDKLEKVVFYGDINQWQEVIVADGNEPLEDVIDCHIKIPEAPAFEESEETGSETEEPAEEAPVITPPSAPTTPPVEACSYCGSTAHTVYLVIQADFNGYKAHSEAGPYEFLYTEYKNYLNTQTQAIEHQLITANKHSGICGTVVSGYLVGKDFDGYHVQIPFLG